MTLFMVNVRRGHEYPLNLNEGFVIYLTLVGRRPPLDSRSEAGYGHMN
jgi:hypothetical protein